MDQWEAPDSEASEPEDEFEWLWQRGSKVIHDHWPSPWRIRTSQLVNGISVTKDVSFSRPSSASISSYPIDGYAVVSTRRVGVIDSQIL